MSVLRCPLATVGDEGGRQETREDVTVMVQLRDGGGAWPGGRGLVGFGPMP